jgi:hypothetical protein
VLEVDVVAPPEPVVPVVVFALPPQAVRRIADKSEAWERRIRRMIPGVGPAVGTGGGPALTPRPVPPSVREIAPA